MNSAILINLDYERYPGPLCARLWQAIEARMHTAGFAKHKRLFLSAAERNEAIRRARDAVAEAETELLAEGQLLVDAVREFYWFEYAQINDLLSPNSEEVEVAYDLDALTFDDPKAYQILKDANTTAIFQVESDGMKKLLKKLAPDRFEDIIAVLALYRPGPLGSGMVDDFILRKKGQQAIDYFHPDLTACLSPTYGVIVYQEQVMQISQIIGGYTLGGADMLRRAMGKKKADEMAKHRETIADGARQKGYDPALAEQLFDLMTKFAEYGFNKSHTAAYAVVTYHTAWLKAHHCAAFMAATLSSDMDNTDTVKIFYDDALANKLKVLGPDVNASEYRFAPVDRSTIRYGLGAVKGTGEQAVNVILKARAEGGPFKDLFDFCLRVDKRMVNRRTIEALIRAGAFDSLDDHRARLIASVGIAMEAAEQAERNAMQVSLFDVFDSTTQAEHGPQYCEVPRWTERQKLTEEKIALGFFFSGHPFSAVKAEVYRPTWAEPQRLEYSLQLAHLLAANGYDTCLWLRDAAVAEAVIARHENPRYLPAARRIARALYFDYSIQDDFYPQFNANTQALWPLLDKML